MKTPEAKRRKKRIEPIPLRTLRRDCVDRLTMRSLPVPTEDFAVTLLHETLPPRSATTPIYHERTEEFLFVLKGRATAYLDGRRVPLSAGDTLRIHSGVEHRFTTGKSGIEALSLFSPPIDPAAPDGHPGRDPATGKQLDKKLLTVKRRQGERP